MDMTRLSCWPELQKIGFEVIRYRAHGKIVHKGCALRKKLVDTTGKPFYTDIICIEPHNFQHSNKRYHVTGEVATPYYKELYQYNGIGQKEPITVLVDRINDHYSAKEILSLVKKMMQ
jgi:hypothetical protein